MHILHTLALAILNDNRMTIHDYIIEFENLNIKIDNHNMKLPDKVLAFKLLDGASVSENKGSCV